MKAKREWQKGEKNNKNTNKPKKKRKSEEKIWGNSLSRKRISKVTNKRKNQKAKYLSSLFLYRIILTCEFTFILSWLSERENSSREKRNETLQSCIN